MKFESRFLARPLYNEIICHLSKSEKCKSAYDIEEIIEKNKLPLGKNLKTQRTQANKEIISEKKKHYDRSNKSKLNDKSCNPTFYRHMFFMSSILYHHVLTPL